MIAVEYVSQDPGFDTPAVTDLRVEVRDAGGAAVRQGRPSPANLLRLFTEATGILSGDPGFWWGRSFHVAPLSKPFALVSLSTGFLGLIESTSVRTATRIFTDFEAVYSGVKSPFIVHLNWEPKTPDLEPHFEALTDLVLANVTKLARKVNDIARAEISVDPKLALAVRDALQVVHDRIRNRPGETSNRPSVEVDAVPDPDVPGPPAIDLVVRLGSALAWQEQSRIWDELSEAVGEALTAEYAKRVFVSIEPG